MISLVNKFLPRIFLFFVSIASFPVRAQEQTNENPSETTGPLTTIQNPLGSVNTLPEFVKKLLDIVLTIGVPIVAFFLVYTGFLFVTAQGNKEKLTAAKNALLYTVIGAAVLLGAWVLAQALADTIEQIRTGQ